MVKANCVVVPIICKPQDANRYPQIRNGKPLLDTKTGVPKPDFCGKNPSYWMADGEPRKLSHGKPPTLPKLLAQINTVLVTTLAYTERAPSAIASMFAWLGEDSQAAIFNAVRSVDASSYLRSAAGQASGITQATVLIILFVGFYSPKVSGSIPSSKA